MWVNVGRSQFHLPTRGIQVLRGHVGIVMPDLAALEAPPAEGGAAARGNAFHLGGARRRRRGDVPVGQPLSLPRARARIRGHRARDRLRGIRRAARRRARHRAFLPRTSSGRMPRLRRRLRERNSRRCRQRRAAAALSGNRRARCRIMTGTTSRSTSRISPARTAACSSAGSSPRRAASTSTASAISWTWTPASAFHDRARSAQPHASALRAPAGQSQPGADQPRLRARPRRVPRHYTDPARSAPASGGRTPLQHPARIPAHAREPPGPARGRQTKRRRAHAGPISCCSSVPRSCGASGLVPAGIGAGCLPGQEADRIRRAVSRRQLRRRHRARAGRGYGQAARHPDRGGEPAGRRRRGRLPIRRAQAPDGHHLVWNSNSISTTYHTGTLPFDYKSFMPVARVQIETPLLFVRSDAPWKSLRDILQQAKANPGKLTVGNSGFGSHTHLSSSVWLFRAAGFQVVGRAVQRRASGAEPARRPRRRRGAVAGRACGPREGRHGARARRAERRARSVFPGRADCPRAGNGRVAELWRGVAVPKGTPPRIVARLEDAIRATVTGPGVHAGQPRNCWSRPRSCRRPSSAG